MNFLDLHSLIEGKQRVLNQANGVVTYFRLWKKLRSKYGKNTEEEAFYAGYLLGSNVMLREKYIAQITTNRHLENNNNDNTFN